MPLLSHSTGRGMNSKLSLSLHNYERLYSLLFKTDINCFLSLKAKFAITAQNQYFIVHVTIEHAALSQRDSIFYHSCYDSPHGRTALSQLDSIFYRSCYDSTAERMHYRSQIQYFIVHVTIVQQNGTIIARFNILSFML